MHDECGGRGSYRESLHRLARAYRVSTDYWGQAGNHVQVDDDIIVAVLASLGVDASEESAIEASLRDAGLREWRRKIPPVFVTWQGEQRRLWVHVPHGDPVRARIELTDGATFDLQQLDWWVDPIEVDGVLTGEASFTVPEGLPIGWHSIHVVTPSGDTSCPLAVAPDRLDPESVIGERQWGLMTQIYSWPSNASWGVGDAVDLAAIGSWSAREYGAGFVLVNPWHAPMPGVPSPYLPSSRRFLNPLMIRPEQIPEYSHLNVDQRLRIEEWRSLAQSPWSVGDDEVRVDRDTSWRYLRLALESVHAVDLAGQRAIEFDEFCGNDSLRTFATWCAIADQFGGDFRAWPVQLRTVRSSAVAEYADAHASAVRFHMWVQWVAAQQVAFADCACREAGMAIGVITDLAVGVHPGGADAWALASVMAGGVGVGAPPDMYNQQGQNWDQPPWRPQALADAAFAPFREVLRAALTGAGGVRIDHILGLFRMWWIPDGHPATEGTYVGFDHDAMLAITCLEAHLASAVVIGEDLGTVEPWVQHELARRGILGTVISWFERTDSGLPVPIESWRPRALASVTVHDLPPTAGYLAGEHVRIRAELGLLAGDDEDVRREWESADAERDAWARLLRERGYLAHDANLDEARGRERMVVALHRALASSPCQLIGVGAGDLAGDIRAQNQPGTDREYPNWCMPTADQTGRPVHLDDFLRSPPPLAGEILDAVRR